MKQFWHKNKLLIALFAFGIALCAYLFATQQPSTPTTATQILEETTIDAPNPETEIQPDLESSLLAVDTTTQETTRENTSETPDTSPPTTQLVVKEEKNEQTEETPPASGISVTLSIPHATFSQSITTPEGSSAYDLMNTLRERGILTFTDSSYGNLGRFIESIDGIKNDYKEKRFWIYYINGKKATIGISNHTLHSQDVITWNYEKEDI